MPEFTSEIVAIILEKSREYLFRQIMRAELAGSGIFVFALAEVEP